MKWLVKLVTDFDKGLNFCLGTSQSNVGCEKQLKAPALSGAGAQCSIRMPPGPYLNAVVIDKSDSMGIGDFKPSRIIAAKKAARAFADKRFLLSPKDQMTIIGFDTEAKVYLPWSFAGDQREIEKALNRIKAAGGTELYYGLIEAKNMIFKALNSSYTPRILLLTDGHGGDPTKLAKQVKAQGILIQVIGIGGDPSDVNEKVLKAVATTDSDGFTHYWFIKDSQSLVEHYEQLSTGIVLRRT